MVFSRTDFTNFEKYLNFKNPIATTLLFSKAIYKLIWLNTITGDQTPLRVETHVKKDVKIGLSNSNELQS